VALHIVSVVDALASYGLTHSGQRRLLPTLCGVLLAVALLFGMAFAAEGPFYIKGTKVNLRTTPEGEVLEQLVGGEKLFVIAREGLWCHISLPVLGKKGWVHGDYINEDTINKDTAEVEPAATAQSEHPAAQRVTPLETDATEVLTGDNCVNPDAPVAKQAAKAKAGGPEVRFAADVKLTSPAKLGSTEYTPAGGHELASITAANVNLRDKPALNAAVLGKVEAGDRAYVITNSDPWYLVSVPSRSLKGWVFGEYMDTLPRVEIKADDVRLREEPGLDGRVREQLAKGDVFFKLEQRDGWVKVASSASGLSGWVKAEYVKRSEGSVSRPYKVTGDDVNFRASPAVDAEVMAKMPQGAQVAVLGRNEKWSYVYYEGHKGWMYSDYIVPVDSAGRELPRAELRAAAVSPRKTLSWKQVGGKSIGDRLITRADAMMGTPYVWGGESDGGVDCSGLIYKLLCDEGCDVKCLPRRASEQMAQLGLAVEKEELEPGDLVFFTTYKSGASHVGIYLGDGDFIHASSAQAKVTVSNLSEGYYRKRFVGARRITEEQLKGMQQ
jgi:uncharacterized protein YgiM (DUF1202 family)